MNTPHMPGVRANVWPSADTQRQGCSSPRHTCCLHSSPRTWAR